MNVFDTLFPPRTRRPRRSSPPAAAPRRRSRGLDRAEALEQRLALAVVTPFDVAYTANARGDITIAANTLMTAPASAGQAAIDAQNG
ncbi:MAG: hypothetical protein RLZZ111_141, partial [Planctomycetota bacterium]